LKKATWSESEKERGADAAGEKENGAVREGNNFGQAGQGGRFKATTPQDTPPRINQVTGGRGGTLKVSVGGKQEARSRKGWAINIEN